MVEHELVVLMVEGAGEDCLDLLSAAWLGELRGGGDGGLPEVSWTLVGGRGGGGMRALGRGPGVWVGVWACAEGVHGALLAWEDGVWGWRSMLEACPALGGSGEGARGTFKTVLEGLRNFGSGESCRVGGSGGCALWGVGAVGDGWDGAGVTRDLGGGDRGRRDGVAESSGGQTEDGGGMMNSGSGEGT